MAHPPQQWNTSSLDSKYAYTVGRVTPASAATAAIVVCA